MLLQLVQRYIISVSTAHFMINESVFFDFQKSNVTQAHHKMKFVLYLVAYERHSTVVGPGKVRDWCTAVINQLYAPSSFVFNPYENYSGAVAWG